MNRDQNITLKLQTIDNVPEVFLPVVLPPLQLKSSKPIRSSLNDIIGTVINRMSMSPDKRLREKGHFDLSPKKKTTI